MQWLKNLIKWYEEGLCKIGWHKITYPHHSSDDPLQFLVYAKCGRCGYEGQIDSQGNLF